MEQGYWQMVRLAQSGSASGTVGAYLREEQPSESPEHLQSLLESAAEERRALRVEQSRVRETERSGGRATTGSAGTLRAGGRIYPAEAQRDGVRGDPSSPSLSEPLGPQIRLPARRA
jgi:hypothetical protein